jgi:hypothetical protein
VANKPEERACAEIDRRPAAAGWSVQSTSEANIHAEEIVRILQEELGMSNDFAQRISCHTSAVRLEGTNVVFNI